MKIWKNEAAITIVSVVVISLIFLVPILLSDKMDENEKTVESVSVAPIDHFEEDTADVILMLGKRIDKLESLSVEDQKVLDEYYEKYRGNPRLDRKQDFLQTDVSMLDFNYLMYKSYIQSDEDGDVKTANEAIEKCFDQLRRFEDQGYQIK